MRPARPVARLFASRAILSVSTIAASFVGLALTILLPFVLPIDQYARYSVLFSFSQLVSILIFEWARIGVIRYSQTAEAVQAASRSNVLAAGYAVAFGLLSGAAVLCASLASLAPWLWPAAIVSMVAALQGLFEGQQADARACGDNTHFSARMVARAIAGLVGALGCGWLFRSGEAALLGLAVTYPIVGMIGWRTAASRLRSAPFSWPELRFLFRFGLLAAVGTNLSIAAPALARGALLASLGPDRAGGVLLAVDLFQRAFSTIGAAVNVVVFQNAIRALEFGDDRGKRKALRDQILAVSCLVLPVAIAFGALHTQLANTLIPPVYRDSFTASSVLAVAAMGVITIRQYSLDPLFIVFGRAGGAPAGPAVLLLTPLVYAAIPGGVWETSLGWAMAPLLATAVVSMTVTVLILNTLTPINWPFRDIARMALISAAMIITGTLLPQGANLIVAAGLAVVLALEFVGGMLALNVLGARTSSQRLLRRLRGV